MQDGYIVIPLAIYLNVVQKQGYFLRSEGMLHSLSPLSYNMPYILLYFLLQIRFLFFIKHAQIFKYPLFK